MLDACTSTASPVADLPPAEGATIDFDMNFESALLARLRDLWHAKRAGRAMPSRADFTPQEMPDLISSIMLLDVLDGPDFRFRLIGTRLTKMRGADVTGQRISQHLGQGIISRRYFYGLMQALETRRPFRMFAERALMPALQYMSVESFFGPLSSDGETIDKIIVGVEPLLPQAFNVG